MATIAAAATAFTTLHLSRTSFILPSRRLRTFVTSSFSTTTTITAEFNIKFAPPKPKPQLPNPSAPDLDPPDSSTSELGDQLFIPWIVRDENGNLTLRATPPERFLKAMAHQNTQKKKKKDVKSAANKVKQPAPSAEPKYSKAEHAPILNVVMHFLLTRVDPDRDVIYVNGNRLPKKLPPKVYLALNKPKGYICSAGEKETKSVMSLFDDFMKSWSKRNPGLPRPRLFTVGRLDVATTGLIIVTNDGEFANKVSHPSSNLSKEYIATINGAVHKRHLFAISEGTVIEGVHCTPDSVELLPQQPDISRPRLRIVVHEGRNHEVRELVKNAGLQIHALKRVRIGGFRLPTDLALGKHVELSSANLRALGWKS
ncbi:putative ribosomal large subunit pseudouridine synthase SVR1, chloroplastic [Sesamum angolense]|uniref:Ribosomal large subunit pseudouridine synthase SVR1, chloroplastic n=1 Tax=Sesamum angolense TaxID=2727404 RepID=A0AAE2BZW5_9LAMI|nr:putative ribosomal large subunit pseudouridine synthase SVR1, chloroplastic [Sesamum angolense]